MTPWLTPDELHELTGRVRWSAQARKLRAMGIRHILSGEGRPLVERRVVLSEDRRKPPAEPDWSKLVA